MGGSEPTWGGELVSILEGPEEIRFQLVLTLLATGQPVSKETFDELLAHIKRYREEIKRLDDREMLEQLIDAYDRILYHNERVGPYGECPGITEDLLEQWLEEHGHLPKETP
jgi:hypothetical protein